MSAPLHLIFRAGALAACVGRLSEESVLLLLEDGVYARPPAGLAGHRLYVLSDHLTARGLPTERPGCISLAEFVTLTTLHHPIVSWF